MKLFLSIHNSQHLLKSKLLVLLILILLIATTLPVNVCKLKLTLPKAPCPI